MFSFPVATCLCLNSPDALAAVIDRLMNCPKPTYTDVDRIKFDVAREFRLKEIPGNSSLIPFLRSLEERERLLPLLIRKRTRAASGVIVIAVMTKPLPCPHGRCKYCPGGPDEGVPQSYTGHEPASMRGVQNNYDAFSQVSSRIRQLRSIGHIVDKVELVLMGGTFPSAPLEYQQSFVKGCLDGLLGHSPAALEESLMAAETSEIRNVGITVETRPDFSGSREFDNLLKIGVTRVELGVQNVYDDIYERVDRGHRVKDVVGATRFLKDAGLKVGYHMMPGLPGASFQQDFEGFKRIFSDPLFKPDMVKIYPTLVIKGTELHEMWRRGEYEPLTSEEAVRLLSEVKELVPPWVRIMRVQRDIPAGLVEAGVRRSNLRELVLHDMQERGKRCRCIRCREIGHTDQKLGSKLLDDDLAVHNITYEASSGTEEFLSIEDPESQILVALLRLRIPSEAEARPEIDPHRDTIVRELHVYGQMIPVRTRTPEAKQHKGWGSLLLSEAERLSRERYDRSKILVTSALGAKEYFFAHGYSRDGVYVSKQL